MKGRAGDPSVEMERDGKESAISSVDHLPARAVARAGPAFDEDSRAPPASERVMIFPSSQDVISAVPSVKRDLPPGSTSGNL